MARGGSSWRRSAHGRARTCHQARLRRPSQSPSAMRPQVEGANHDLGGKGKREAVDVRLGCERTLTNSSPRLDDAGRSISRRKTCQLSGPRSGFDLLRRQQVFACQLGGRLAGLSCPLDWYPDNYGIRALNSCRARHEHLSYLCESEGANRPGGHSLVPPVEMALPKSAEAGPPIYPSTGDSSGLALAGRRAHDGRTSSGSRRPSGRAAR